MLKPSMLLLALLLAPSLALAGEYRTTLHGQANAVDDTCAVEVIRYNVDNCVGAGDPVPCCTGADTGNCPPHQVMCCAPDECFWRQRTAGVNLDGSQDVTGEIDWRTCDATGCANGDGTANAENACLTVANSTCPAGETCAKLAVDPDETVVVTLDESATAGDDIMDTIPGFRYSVNGTPCGADDCDDARVWLQFCRSEAGGCTDDLTELACFSVLRLTEAE